MSKVCIIPDIHGSHEWEKAKDIKEIENEKSRAYQTKMYVLNKVPEYKQQVEDQYKNLSR